LFERRRHGLAWLALLALLIVAESWAAPIPVNINSTDYGPAGLAPPPGPRPASLAGRGRIARDAYCRARRQLLGGTRAPDQRVGTRAGRTGAGGLWLRQSVLG